MGDKEKKPFCYAYPRPSVTVDVALVTEEKPPRVLLIRRKADPFAGKWALPGGFVDENERLIDAARREIKEETGLDVAHLQQVQTFGDPGRDPRGWTVSVVFLGRVGPRLTPIACDDAAEAGWFPLDAPPPLAFDHAEILGQVNEGIRC